MRTASEVNSGTSSYIKVRKKAKQHVLAALRKYEMVHSLRGSWNYGDFHISPDGKSTRSDLDIVLLGASSAERKEYRDRLQRDFDDTLGLRVSVHGADSLLMMTLNDSFVLNTGEFLSKTIRDTVSQQEYEYTLAKISLLLLRQRPDERYEDTARRIGTREAAEALAVKFGVSDVFSNDSAKVLLSTSSNPVVGRFLDMCVLERPSRQFVHSMYDEIRRCRSIEPWLQEYLISKIAGELS